MLIIRISSYPDTSTWISLATHDVGSSQQVKLWKLDIWPFTEQAEMSLNVTLNHNTTKLLLVSTNDVAIARSCGKGISFRSTLNMKYFYIFKMTFIKHVFAITSRSEFSRNNWFFKHWLWCEFSIDYCFLNNVHVRLRYYINPSHETFFISFQMQEP